MPLLGDFDLKINPLKSSFSSSATRFFAQVCMRSVMSSPLLEIDSRRRAAILAAETAQAEQNKASKSLADEFKQKSKYGELLMTLAEQKVKAHRLNMRSKNIDEIKFKCK